VYDVYAWYVCCIYLMCDVGDMYAISMLCVMCDVCACCIYLMCDVSDMHA